MSTRSVRDALRAAAESHQPDRAAILARIRLGQASLDASRAPGRSRRRVAVRTAGMAATVAAVLGLGVAVTWAAVGNPVVRPQSHPASAMAPAPPAPPSPTPSHGGPSHAASAPTTTTTPSRSAPSSPAGTRAQQGFLWSGAAIDPKSIDNWTQGKVTLRTTETVTALQLRVQIVLTPYVASTGSWSTILAEDLVSSVEQQHDAVVYLFTLKPGVTLAPGTYVFGVQYNQATGRDHSKDTYQAVATAGGSTVDVSGGF